MRLLPLLVTSAVLVFSPLLSAAGLIVKKGDTIAFLGDSITAQGAASSAGYVRLVASGLAAQGIDVTVIPAGISGHKSDQMLARLESDVLSKKPTWMTLSCGVNDVWHGAKGVSLEDYKTNIKAILDRCQQAGVKVVILTSTQIKLPVTSPENVKLADYNAFLRDTAKARNLPLADLNVAMAAEQTANPKRVLTVDGVHMNLYGNLMMAKGVLGAFGLNDKQLAAVNTSWMNQPDLYQSGAKIKLSLNELAALEAVAAKQNKSVDALITDISTAAVKATLPAGK
ncbi:SGNH/GDSL hydrolase family protein [Rariglobus hedericola]|uniref:SGNH/GDSL hydrolase family protein n=1 Tax=Rariglobus hedericola TaxID=2597822 RepID=A0A556QGR2_9BACT|nr:SGNH/GDSL hydrolase family protein [Rariglobus hedericola]TSJ75811.1 SGNH/GDSL hydrolase family protein [Rariglobus hedericola]